MRILYIHQFFATRESSLGLIRSYEFARRWVEQGHEVTVVTSSSRLPASYSEKRYSEGVIDGIRVRSVRVPYSNYMGYGRRMVAFATFMIGATRLAVTAERPDVVLATSTPLTVGFPGWIAALRHRSAFVFEVRDLWPEAAIQMGAISRHGIVGIVGKAMERFLYRHASHVIALSPGMVEGVLAEGKPAERVHMVPNSSDLDLFSPGEKDAELLDRYGVAGKFVIGYAGAIGPSNAVEDNVPEAARLLHARGRDDIIFLILGEGKSLPELASRVAGLPNVHLEEGVIPKADVPRFTRTADALLVSFADKPILATNSPNKFFDALATGRPVLLNQPAWTRELVEEHDCGIYFPAGDGAALAAAAERLADDREHTRQMGVNARNLAEERFSRDLLAQQVLSVLEAAVAERS